MNKKVQVQKTFRFYFCIEILVSCFSILDFCGRYKWLILGSSIPLYISDFLSFYLPTSLIFSLSLLSLLVCNLQVYVHIAAFFLLIVFPQSPFKPTTMPAPPLLCSVKV